ncbi:unnamed protein product, partial [Didymodactylos carnosus]
YQLIAQSYIKKEKYKKAIETYEKVIEIQFINLSDTHPDIKESYYQIGNIYCKMDELDKALEFYRKTTITTTTTTTMTDDDNENSDGDEMSDTLLIEKYRNLAEFYERNDNYEHAIEQEQNILIKLEKHLPNIAKQDDLKIIKVEKLIDNHLNINNIRLFVNYLQDFVYIYLTIGDLSLIDNENASIWYEKAFDLHRKLIRYHSLNDNLISIMYYKIGQVYQRYDEIQTAIEQYLDAYNANYQSENKFIFFYEIGYLYKENKNYNEADTWWKKSLSETTNEIIKNILQKKIDSIEDQISSDDENDDNDNIDDNDNNKKKNQISINNKYSKAEMIIHTSNDQLAMAYLELNVKYYKKYIEEQKLLLINDEIMLNDDWINIKINDDFIQFIPDLIFQYKNDYDKDDDDRQNPKKNIVRSYMECGRIALKLKKFADACNYYLQAIETEHLKSNETLRSLLSNNKTGQDDIINNYSKQESQLWINMKMGAYNRNNGHYDASLLNYQKALTYTNDLMIKITLYYEILKLFKISLRSTEDYKQSIVNKINLNTTSIRIYDRLLIYELIIDFMKELYEDNNENNNSEIQKYIDMFYQTQLQTNFIIFDHYEIKMLSFQCIGHVLRYMEDYTETIDYWNEIIKLKQQILSQPIIELINNDESTFIKIYDNTKLYKMNFQQSLKTIANSYEKIAEYYEKLINNTNDNDRWDPQMAISNYENALKFLKKMNNKEKELNDKIQYYEDRIKTLKSNINNVEHNNLIQ